MSVSASIVWCSGQDHVCVPEAMGAPREDQLQGTVAEQLAEICGRICYDSLGAGRSSEAYHQHILECGHRSVYEHCPITIEFDFAPALEAIINRPGLWFERKGTRARLTVNLRTIYEYSHIFGSSVSTMDQVFQYAIRVHGHAAAPHVISLPADWDNGSWLAAHIRDLTRVVPAESENERWASLWLRGSRGFSHEMVRHGDQTAISQRSTRYVDEAESAYLRHPLIRSYLADTHDEEMLSAILAAEVSAKATYSEVVKRLIEWQKGGGVDTSTARKQARGAAREYLGHALETQMVFSASIAQWRHIIDMRVSPAADAQIREIIAEARECLSSKGVL